MLPHRLLTYVYLIQIFAIKLHTSRCKPIPSVDPVIVTKEFRNGLLLNSVSKNSDEKNFKKFANTAVPKINTISMAKAADKKTLKMQMVAFENKEDFMRGPWYKKRSD